MHLCVSKKTETECEHVRKIYPSKTRLLKVPRQKRVAVKMIGEVARKGGERRGRVEGGGMRNLDGIAVFSAVEVLGRMCGRNGKKRFSGESVAAWIGATGVDEE